MSVLVCVPSRDSSPSHSCLIKITEACGYHGSSSIFIASNPHNVCVSRNMGIAVLLNSDHSHILFVDDDTTIPPETISLLEGLGANVASGCVPTTRNKPPFLFLTIASGCTEDGCTWRDHWFDGVVETPVCGGACMMVKREVFEKIGFPWFVYPQTYKDGILHYESEDIGFCRKINKLGLGPIMAHGNVRCGHTRLTDVAQFMTEAP